MPFGLRILLISDSAHDAKIFERIEGICKLIHIRGLDDKKNDLDELAIDLVVYKVTEANLRNACRDAHKLKIQNYEVKIIFMLYGISALEKSKLSNIDEYVDDTIIYDTNLSVLHTYFQFISDSILHKMPSEVLSNGRGSVRVVDESSASNTIKEVSDGTIHDGIPKQKKTDTKVIAFISYKGGVGKTFLAVNIGCLLAKMHNKRTLLIDGDIASSDISVHLNLSNKVSIMDLLPEINDLSSCKLEQGLQKHRSSGLYVLTGPARPELAEFITEGYLERIIECATQLFDYILVDTSSHPMDDTLYQIIEKSSEIVYITTADLASIKQTKIAIDTIKRLGYSDYLNQTYILNQYCPSSKLDPNVISTHLNVTCKGMLLHERIKVEDSIYEGKPIALGHGSSETKTQLIELTKMILGTNESVSKFSGAGKKSKFDGLYKAIKERWITNG
jgi:pilus assembly protein CpaE